MTKLLFIKASPRPASKSLAIAEAYLAALRAKNPDIEVDVIDVWQERLPEFDGNKVNAKIAIFTGQRHDGAQKTAWDEISAIANRFAAADHYLFAIPMWNGGIPYPLKHYIDVIHQPGILFGLVPETGYFGLLKNKKATVVLTSGAYSPEAPSPAYGVDHHSSYMNFWLNQAGVSDIEEIRFQPTLLTGDPEGDFAKVIQNAKAAGTRATA